MADLLTIHDAGADTEGHVIFLHGLGGDGRETWGFQREPSWHTWIHEACPRLSIWSYDYEVKPSSWLGGKALPRVDRATELLARLDALDIAEKPTVLIGHSLGGLLAKELLRRADTSPREFAEVRASIHGLVFLGTPHGGAQLANLADLARVITRRTVAVKELQRHNAELRNLNEWFRNRADEFEIRVFCETQAIKGVKVVDIDSADPGLAHVTAIMVEADHIQIAKPQKPTEITVLQTLKLLRQVFAKTPKEERSTQDRSSIVGSVEPNPVAKPESRPDYRSEHARRAGEELKTALHQHDLLAANAGDTTMLDQRILELKRHLRHGPQLHPGELLADNRFQLERILGDGGFATVWRALDRRTGEPVALKVLHGQFANNHDRRERLFRGARKMAELDHRHIARVISEPMEEDGWAFFALELLAEKDFRRAVLDGDLNVEQRLDALTKVADALDYAHQSGLVHRDVKPGNILLDEASEPRLTDFDLVLAHDSTGLTRTRAGMGSYHYAAPEAMEDAANATHKCDIYGLAACLVFAVSGSELSSRFLIQREAFLATLELSQSAREMLGRALSMDPQQRPNSASELCQEFAVARQAPIEPPPSLEETSDGKLGHRASGSPGRTRGDYLLPDHLEERREAFLGIPDQLADANACLDLAEQLKENNSNGFDLYFLHWIVEQVEERWPGSAQRGRDLLDRLFEHLPPPADPELFMRVTTQRDGQVDLWQQIDAGHGWIGSPKGIGLEDGHPRHEIEIVRPFWLAAVPITNAQYAAFDPSKTPTSWPGVATTHLPNHPRVKLNWYEAVSFCRWLEARCGFEGARLPREEEWEYACRAGSSSAYWNGDAVAHLEEVGWYNGISEGRTHRVGSKIANPWNLYDVHGNTREWTVDAWQSEKYQKRPPDNPFPVDPSAPPEDSAEPGDWRVVRGGGCWDGADGARAACRLGRDPHWQDRYQGFRVLLSSPPDAFGPSSITPKSLSQDPSIDLESRHFSSTELEQESEAVSKPRTSSSPGRTTRGDYPLPKDLNERCKAFFAVPDQLADASACLDLVEQLKESNSNGFDLYFLHWIVERVAKRWPNSRRRSRDLIDRLFDHLPPPADSELFMRVTTQRDGQVDLWQPIPAGRGWIGSPEDMGRPNETPRHEIEITRPFWLAAVPVTNAQYEAFDPSKKLHPWPGMAKAQLVNHPRVYMTWYEAVSFCRWLAACYGFMARLPREEEWEYACRADSSSVYWNGDTEAHLEESGWYETNSDNRTHPVGSKIANSWNLYDVHGNVWEWTLDAWQPKKYQRRSLTKPFSVDPAIHPEDSAAPGDRRVMRGGGCWDGADWAQAAYRFDWDPRWKFRDRGFRVLLSSPPADPRR